VKPKSTQANPKSTQVNPKSTQGSPKSTPSQLQVNQNQPQVNPSQAPVNPSQPEVNPKSTQSQPKSAQDKPKSASSQLKRGSSVAQVWLKCGSSMATDTSKRDLTGCAAGSNLLDGSKSNLMLQKRSSQATYTNHSVAAKALRSSPVCGKLYCWRSHTHATNYYEVVGARNQLNLSTNYYEVVGARNQLNLFVNSS